MDSLLFDTIEKWMRDGLTLEDAINRLEVIIMKPVPENIKCLVRQQLSKLEVVSK